MDRYGGGVRFRFFIVGKRSCQRYSLQVQVTGKGKSFFSRDRLWSDLKCLIEVKGERMNERLENCVERSWICRLLLLSFLCYICLSICDGSELERTSLDSPDVCCFLFFESFLLSWWEWMIADGTRRNNLHVVYVHLELKEHVEKQAERKKRTKSMREILKTRDRFPRTHTR